MNTKNLALLYTGQPEITWYTYIFNRYIKEKFRSNIFKSVGFGSTANKEFVKNFQSVSEQLNFLMDGFNITARSRGLEMKLIFTKPDSGYRVTEVNFIHSVIGHWLVTNDPKILKDALLIFTTRCNEKLVLVDRISYTQCQEMEEGEWTKGLGPDIFDNNHYIQLKNAVDCGKPIANQPVSVAMMNLRYFNGVPNYLRVEVINKLKISPKMTLKELYANEYKSGNLPNLYMLCKTITDVAHEAHLTGGNMMPEVVKMLGIAPDAFKKSLCVAYTNAPGIKDETGLFFQYNPKWESVMKVK